MLFRLLTFKALDLTGDPTHAMLCLAVHGRAFESMRAMDPGGQDGDAKNKQEARKLVGSDKH
jgi:hypothetical protein